MKNLIILLAFSMICAVQTSFAQKIGHINSFELLSLMPEAQKVETDLEVLAKDLESQYTAYVSELESKYLDYQTNAGQWSDTKREAVEVDIRTLETRIQDFQTSSQQKIAQKRQDLLEPILAKAETAISDVAKEQGFTYIIDSSAGSLVYIGDDATDILPMVKTKLNL